MRRISLLLTLAAVLAGCQSMGPEPSERSIYSGNNSVLYRARQQAGSLEQALQLADLAYRAGDLDQALFQYLRALELDPKRHSALVWVGRIHRERGNIQLAELAFDEVLRSSPDDLEALAEMGMLQLAKRDQEKGRALLYRALLLDQRRLGGERPAGLPAPDALVVDRQSPVRLYNALGVLADLTNDFPLAERYYRLALQVEPRSLLVHNSLGYSYYMAGRWQEAERTYSRALDHGSDYAPLWRNYGLLMARTARYEEALSAFEQIGSRAQASNDVGYVCLVEGKLNEAEQFFRSALEQSPSHYATAWENLERVRQLRKIRQLGLGMADPT
ncbi:Tfp pilus assembly protein PilF [Stutzerimonas stutzeri]|uniref:Tfp pilus assembly protein PilF n=1 Tax=Stutzerimonas stutzeri TaxID=316 RepID=A0A2N8SXF8_STUST|nr:tetratricopeptide repeat protein [Stutzerimonas stutzeri]MCQ4326040.1 tetratricopeptide repeat protein [Stutzerimonas stutzeri]PNG07181.1 Tfp pilus assembly protein PilF [Stutzerimonas stutzeri]